MSFIQQAPLSHRHKRQRHFSPVTGSDLTRNKNRFPLSVYRLSHRMTNKALTHGQRFTITRSAAQWDPNNQKPVAGSDLAPGEKAKRLPLRPFPPFSQAKNRLIYETVFLCFPKEIILQSWLRRRRLRCGHLHG